MKRKRQRITKEEFLFVLSFISPSTSIVDAYNIACTKRESIKEIDCKAFINKVKHIHEYKLYKEFKNSLYSVLKKNYQDKLIDQFIKSWFKGRTITKDMERLFVERGRVSEMEALKKSE